MTDRAVVFDLFHTLIDPEPRYPPGFDKRAAIADLAGVDPTGLIAFWETTYVERETTPIDLVDLFDRHCSSMNRPLDDAIRAAIDHVLGVAVDQAVMEPDPEIVALLEDVRSVAAVGVLSNCHEREVRNWDVSPLAPHCDAFGRSSRIGAMKPEPAAYRWIVDRLGVPPSQTVYVGNGGSDELLGARAAGFATIIHCNVYDRHATLVRPEDQARRAQQADASVEDLPAMRDAVVEALASLA